MGRHFSEDDLNEKSSRTQNRKHKQGGKHRIAEGEFRGMQKKTNFKHYLNQILEDDSYEDELDESADELPHDVQEFLEAMFDLYADELNDEYEKDLSLVPELLKQLGGEKAERLLANVDIELLYDWLSNKFEE